MRPTAIKSLCTALLLGSTAFSVGAIEIDGGTNVVYDGIATNDTSLFVGRYDNDNSLTISNGASVSVETGYIGGSSDNNTLTVTGTNSALNTSESLQIGPNSGKNNHLDVNSGGQVVVGSAAGTAGAISVGSTNENIALTIGNGSSAITETLYVGTANDELGSLTLSGSGTELIISDTAYIGAFGSNNVVNVNSGSSMTVSNLLQVGSGSNSNNALNIRGETIIVGSVDVQNPDSNKVNIKSGGQLTYTGNANLNDAAENGFNFESGSTLEIGGALTFDKMDTGVSVILNNDLNTNLTSTWNSGSEEMYVGDSTGNNHLTVKGGASATAGGSTAHIGEFSSDNSISIEGSNSTLLVSGQIIAGMEGDRNKLNITDGGSADIGTNLRVGLQTSANNNEVNISGTNAILTVSGDTYIGDKGSSNQLNVNSGGTFDFSGDLYIGKEGDENIATLEGSNTVATAGGNLLIGLEGNENELNIESGAQLILSTGDAYIGTNGADNIIYVTGTNSYLEVADSLWMGNFSETNDLTGNTLSAFDTASISIGNDLRIYNGSSLKIEAGSQVTVGGDYYQDETSDYAFSVSTNSAGMTNLIVSGSATFASNTTITVYNDGTETNTFEQTAVSSSALYLGDTNVLATTAMLNDTNNIIFVNDLLYIGGVVTNNSIVLTTAARSLSDRSGLTGTYLEPLGDEIDAIAFSGTAESENAIAMRNILGTEYDSDEARNTIMLDYYGEKESSLPARNVINLGVQNVEDQVTMRADNTRARQGMASSQTDFNKPEGANGPHQSDQEFQGWITGYGSKGSMSATDGYHGYDASLSGFLIGADAAINENWLIGLAGGSGSSSTDKSDAHMDTKTIYGTGYASVGTKEWFADMGFIYGNSDVDASLGTVFDTQASYSSQNFALFAGGGKEIAGDYFIFTPQLSFLGNFYMQKAYDEESSDAVGRTVDNISTFNLQSTLGTSMAMYLGMGKVILKPEIRAFWLHEWAGDEERVDYSLIGGTGSYSMLLQAPEKDILKLGIGTSAKLGEYLELRADLDTRLGSDYRDYTLLGSLRYQF